MKTFALILVLFLSGCTTVRVGGDAPSENLDPVTLPLITLEF